MVLQEKVQEQITIIISLYALPVCLKNDAATGSKEISLHIFLKYEINSNLYSKNGY